MRTVLHLGLSYACNMHCKHCFVDVKQDYLVLETLKNAIRYLAEKCGLFIVYYTYGEPFLSHNLESMLDFCNSLGLVQIIMSNGSIISEKTCRMMTKYNIDRVYISLDSCVEEKHDINRGFPGAYRNALRSIHLLKQYGLRVGIATTVNSSNEEEIEEISNLAESLEVASLSLLRERSVGRVASLEDNSQYTRFFHSYIEHKRNFNLLVHDYELIGIVSQSYRKGRITKSDYQKWVDMNSCHAKTTISIAPNGDVFSCNLSKSVYGNLYTDRFEDIIVKMENSHECLVCRT